MSRVFPRAQSCPAADPAGALRTPRASRAPASPFFRPGRVAPLARALICGLLLCLAVAAPVLAPAAQTAPAADPRIAPAQTPAPLTRTVRVGFYFIPGYQVMDASGARGGYAYDLLQNMLPYVNWKYEYVGYNASFADIQDMLERGEIDLVASVVYTPARAKRFDFSARPVVQSSAALVVRAGSRLPYVPGHYATYNGMRVGLLAKSSHIQSLAQFARDKGFTYQPVYYPTSAALAAALQQGTDIDVVVTSDMRILPNTYRLELFDPRPTHIAVRKGNQALLREVDFALEQLKLLQPNLSNDLYEKYYAIDSGGQVFFTPDERNFIANCQREGRVFQAVLRPDVPPYSFVEQGRRRGIMADLAAEILRRTGLRVQVADTPDTASFQQRLKDPGTALWLDVLADYNRAENLGYKLTVPYYDTNVSLLTRKARTGPTRVVAIAPELAPALPRLRFAPDVQLMRQPTRQACLDALRDGVCDAVGVYSETALHLAYEDEINRLTVIRLPDSKCAFAVGIRQTENTLLASILTKAADSLNARDCERVTAVYADYPERPLTLLGTLYNKPFQAVGLVALLAILVIMAVLYLKSLSRRRFISRKNREIQEALDVARKASAVKGEFMGRMSHEMRTPLNAVIGYNTIAQSELAEPATPGRDARLCDCLEKSGVAANHLLSIINDVLDMSSIESGQIKIASQPFDLGRLLRALVPLFHTMAARKGVHFDVEIHELGGEVFVGDALRLNQILMNLLSNAVKFTPAAGQVTLIVARGAGAEGRVRFTVRDTGIGLSPEFMTRIGRPFEQESAGTALHFGGTGLGLSITRSLVSLMHGSFEAAGKPGQGAVFTVELPLAAGAPATEPTFRPGLRVLLLGKDTTGRTRALLEACGLRCTGLDAGDGATGIGAGTGAPGQPDDAPFDLCVLDWDGLDGGQANCVRALRAAASGRDRPILALSRDAEEHADEALAAGATQMLAKPLFLSTVRDTLAGLYGTAPAAAPSAARYRFDGVRVLLAEDHRMNMEIARTLLCRAGFRVDTAVNGQEAVNAYLAAPPGTYQAILLDIRMPVLDGHSACRAIRASGRPDAASVPVVAMTADAFASDVAASRAAGMNAHISKPIDVALLLKTLHELIREQAAASFQS